MKEACGLFGAHSRDGDIAQDLYQGLFALQHRGQEASGFVLLEDDKLHYHRGLGLITEVLERGGILSRKGYVGIAHTRYSTYGESAKVENAQPLLFYHRGKPVAIAHNGTISNARELRRKLEKENIAFQTTTDTEILLHLYIMTDGETVKERFRKISSMAKGAYSLLILDGERLVAVRDPHGFRPLAIGEKDKALFFASESASFDLIGANFIRELQPGEVVEATKDGISSYIFSGNTSKTPCVFELIYFSRPDSIVFEKSVYEFRKCCGRELGKKEDRDIDIVVPVPDSGFPASIGYSQVLGIPLELGLIRSHYIGRSFIDPERVSRKKTVRMKLLALREVLNNKTVAMVDDSIVRGTTSKAIVQLLRDFGAKEVHLRIASPPIVSPCFFGIDTPTKEELLASARTLEEVKEFIGADSVKYLSIKELKECLKGDDSFCYACFTEDYPEDSIPESIREKIMSYPRPPILKEVTNVL